VRLENDAPGSAKTQPHQRVTALYELNLSFIEPALQSRTPNFINHPVIQLRRIAMKSKGFWGTVLIAVVAMAANSALAQTPKEAHFRGTISDYTPQMVMPGGPWEVRGQWSLTIKRNGKADFSAALTMERSDLGVMNTGGGDLNDPTDRNAHTHNFFLCDGNVTFPAKGVIEVSGGKVTITGNGGKPPFGTDNSLTIEITGGSGPNSVAFSNIKVTPGNDAEQHFGPNPLNGVVRSVRWY
jgi:hypothetical protein